MQQRQAGHMDEEEQEVGLCFNNHAAHTCENRHTRQTQWKNHETKDEGKRREVHTVGLLTDQCLHL